MLLFESFDSSSFKLDPSIPFAITGPFSSTLSAVESLSADFVLGLGEGEGRWGDPIDPRWGGWTWLGIADAFDDWLVLPCM